MQKSTGCILGTYLLVISLQGMMFPDLLAQASLEFRDDESLRLLDHPDLHRQVFTFSGWIRKNAGGDPVYSGLPGDNLIPILSRGYHTDDRTNCINFRFGLREGDQILYLEFEALPEGEPDYKTYAALGYTPLLDSTWYHVAASSDGRYIRLYLNGCLESSLEVFQAPCADFDADLSIAATLDNASNRIGAFRGNIDALCIYNYALSQEEILQIMNAEPVSDSPGMLAGFPMNDGNVDNPLILGSIPQQNVRGNSLSYTRGAPFDAPEPPLAMQEEIMRIGIISDPQYCDCETPAWADRVYRKSLVKLPEAIGILNASNVNLSLTLGDVIDTLYVSYDSILPLYEVLSSPHYFILGNHDLAIEDSRKAEVLSRLGMPDYYFEQDYPGWRFLFLDGTELARYARVLHPELADEGDSVRAAIAGQVNDVPWNGGIGRVQQGWIRERIEDAEVKNQHVILFCHFPLLPDSVHLNLWNSDSLVQLLVEYDHVVAYINGHNHMGAYDYRYGKHFITQYSMVETEDSNSFSLLTISPSFLKFEGFGNNPDRIIRYSDAYRTLPPPEIRDSILHYFHDSADYVSELFLPAYPNLPVNYCLTDQRAGLDNEWFAIRNDSLFLAANPDYRIKRQFFIYLTAIDSKYDTSSAFLTLTLDTTVVRQRYPLEDTQLEVDSVFQIAVDSLYEDLSKAGLTILYHSSDPQILETSFTDEYIRIVARKSGTATVEISAFDPYTEYIICDSFTICITDSYNISPQAINQEMQVIQYPDTLRFSTDSLFFDEDGDSLIFLIVAPENPALHTGPGIGSEVILWADTGLSSTLSIVAHDMRGGTDTLMLGIKFNTAPERVRPPLLEEIPLGKEVFELGLDTIYFDYDGDSLAYQGLSQSGAFAFEFQVDKLRIYPSQTGEGNLRLEVSDGYGGLFIDSLYVIIYSESASDGGKNVPQGWKIFPNPADEVLTLQHQGSEPGDYTFCIWNHLGQEVFSGSFQVGPPGIFLQIILLDQLPEGLYFLQVRKSEKEEGFFTFLKHSSE
ncbi:MAG: metallophosphoesterase [Bacteroidales bacterium]|nr:metallophosphoesterase [Bacteroidales bacterium]